MSARDLAAHVLSSLGIASLARHLLVRDGRFALNFHGVSSRRYPEIANDLQPHHSVAEFRQALDWLAPRFAFLTVEEFLTSGKPGILLTFDDGHANNLVNTLPVLTEFKAQGLFFVAVQHVREPRNWLSFTRDYALRGWECESAVPDDFARDCYDGLSKSQLIELAASPWAVVGSHTLTHPSLPTIPLEQVCHELSESRRYLQEISGQVVDCFAYPYAEYNLVVAEAVRDAGYRAAFAVIPNPVGLSAFEIPRVDLYFSNPDYLSLKLSGLHQPALRGSPLSSK